MKKLLLILTILTVTVVGYGQKIEDLPRATTTNATDLLIIEPTDATKGIELQNLYAGSGIEIVLVSNGKLVSLNEAGDDITITTGGTFYQYTAIDEVVVKNMTDATDGLEMDYTGSYLVSVSLSLSVDAADHKVHIGVGKNGTVGIYNKMSYMVKFADRINPVSFTTIACDLSVGDELTIEVTSDTDGDVISIYHAQLVVVFLNNGN